MKLRFALKVATDDIHRELDQRLSLLDLARAPDYCRFLSFQAQTVPPLEDALSEAGAGTIFKGFDRNRRTAAIKSDLAALGETMPAPAMVSSIHGTAELLGTAYVVEGSRLGAQMLQHRVGNGLPKSFLGQPSGDPWHMVVAALDRLLCSEALVAEAKDAARRCFTLFLNVARESGI